MEGTELRAFLIGGDRLVRECVRQLLAPHIEILAEMPDVGSVLVRPPAEMPHVLVFLGIGRDVEAFLDVARQVRMKWPLTRIVALVEHDRAARELLRELGTLLNGCFCNDMGLDSLVHAMNTVLGGHSICCSRLVRAAFADEVAAHGDDREAELTARQLEILDCLAEGWSNKEIARRFGLSEATVKVQVRSILRRLGVENRTQAAVWARKHRRAPVPQAATSVLSLALEPKAARAYADVN